MSTLSSTDGGGVTTAPAPAHGMLTLDELRADVAAGAIDTVLLVLPDMPGRLVGKRLTATHFLDEVVPHHAEGCNYLLANDVDNTPVEGYEIASWERGYGDFVMQPDLTTLRRIPWLEATALCIADVHWEDGSPVAQSPRHILRSQLRRLAERGLDARLATELEFLVFHGSYAAAWHAGYRDLEPVNLYNVDYSIQGTSSVEPLIRAIRNGMSGAGMVVENSKGECNHGQHEVNFRYGGALEAADAHAIYKNGAKEIAAQQGMALTFMAKFDQREGNSCHIHCSLVRADGAPVFGEQPELFDRFVAGQIACLRELALFFAPNVNSYKRFAQASFAPTAVLWGEDNRTCALRAVGHGPSRRIENRMPGADVNPYVAAAAMIAAGLHGIDERLPLEPAFAGNAYLADAPRVPSTLHEARDLFAQSSMARAAFGDDVVNHYLNYARVEIDAFNAAVTDWERFRGFERL